MKRYMILMKTISRILILAMLHLCWLTSYGWAEMAKTNELQANEPQLQNTRELLIDTLNRQDAQEQLQHYGITREEAVRRINSLTDEEISALGKEMDDLPAGGNPVAALVYGALIALYLAIYIPVVLFRGTECIFSDCEAKGGLGYVFGRLGKETSSQSTDYEEEDCDPGIDSCI